LPQNHTKRVCEIYDKVDKNTEITLQKGGTLHKKSRPSPVKKRAGCKRVYLGLLRGALHPVCRSKEIAAVLTRMEPKSMTAIKIVSAKIISTMPMANITIPNKSNTQPIMRCRFLLTVPAGR
jgi:hypothetical protein